MARKNPMPGEMTQVERKADVFVRLDVAYDITLTASVLAGAPDHEDAILTREEQDMLSSALDNLTALRERLVPGATV